MTGFIAYKGELLSQKALEEVLAEFEDREDERGKLVHQGIERILASWKPAGEKPEENQDPETIVKPPAEPEAKPNPKPKEKKPRPKPKPKKKVKAAGPERPARSKAR